MSFTINLWLLQFALLFSVMFSHQAQALTSDGIALLSFKYSVLSDPLSVLESWNYDDVTPCSWTGVTCSKSSTVGSPETMRVTGLILPNSQLSGSVSPYLSLISTLQELDLSGNSFKGPLPLSILNTSNLQKLKLANNAITGEVPALIGALPSLKLLNLSNNALAGKIPGGFKFIEVLDLSSNSLTGSVPVNFDGGNLQFLDISHNQLSGSIPPQFALNVSRTAILNLSSNKFTGEIPQTLAFLNQKSEAFSNNLGLCGKPLPELCSIPSTLSIPPELNSTKPAIAAIPRTISSDPAQDAPRGHNDGQQRKLQPMAIAGIVVGDIAGLGFLAIVIFFVYQMKKKKNADKSTQPLPLVNQNPLKAPVHQVALVQIPSPSPEHKSVFSNWSCLSGKAETDTSDCTSSDADSQTQSPHPHTRRSGLLISVDHETVLEMESLLKASAYVLGTSTSSIVYKAVMQNGTAFAVRRIGDCCVKKMKDFESQVKAVAKLRSPNLVRTFGFYWGEDEKLVISEFVANGNLASAINMKFLGTSQAHLSLEMRLRIARGVARGLALIHDKKHAHGNIKPSNILLDANYEPLISDFGLDKLIVRPRRLDQFGSMRSSASRDGLLDSSSSTGGASPSSALIAGSSPYHAPESFNSSKANPKWDVYSFGVVLLELLTGRALHGFEVGPWAAASFTVEEDDRVLRMADVAIRGEVAAMEDATSVCFKLGFSCANLAPAKRPTMKEVARMLERVVS